MQPSFARDEPDATTAVGLKMRDLRRTHGLTLPQLAEATGLSVGHLSQLERGLSTPTIRQLQVISEALKVRIGWFFEPAEDEPEALVAGEADIVVRAHRRAALEASGIHDQMLMPPAEGPRALQLVHCILEPGATSGEPYEHAGEEAGVVLAGAFELWVGERFFQLQEGDSFAFPSRLPHRYRNPSAVPTRLIWASTPPIY